MGCIWDVAYARKSQKCQPKDPHSERGSWSYITSPDCWMNIHLCVLGSDKMLKDHMYHFIWFFTLTNQLLIIQESIIYTRELLLYGQCIVLSNLYALGLKEGPVEYIYQLYGWELVIGRIMPPPPKDVHILIPGTLWTCYVIWQGGMKIVDGSNVANQLTLRWEDYPGLPGMAQCNQKGPYEWKEGGWRESVRVMWGKKDLTNVAGFKDRRKGPWTKECGQHLEARKAKELIIP